jgi:hypothetical protein
MESPIDPEIIIQLLQEVRFLRDEIAAIKGIQPVIEKITCKGMTGKGVMCKNSALKDSEYCGMHGREPKVRGVPKARKPPKMKKIQPEHTHSLGEKPDIPCPLCETHGDVMEMGLPDALFEGVESSFEVLV